ncbi:hypothetical protein ACQE3E_06735 [Methylomonas sp. MED-D]|uniref:hypothetical protein n=1 Tax=Methylomonas sp. MED-D TaxID=3418768 RepID=UPI003D05F951
MKTIHLLGDLATFKPTWTLDVRTPAEALRAIAVQRPGFLAACDAGDYVALLVDPDDAAKSRQVTDVNAADPWGDEILMVVPRVGGELPVAAVAAVVSTVTGITVANFTLIAAVVNMALSIGISALANVLTGPKTKASGRDLESYQNKPSYIANGAVNVVRAGNPYPLPVGRFRCGTVVLSSNVYVEDIPVNS